ncbi:hypothetical protein BDZ90DRAFT_234975 [Jaminaea rosea]|uniref:Uncharacterized protein n=1 Tax=Jaminaea rosea TaxID=1569628 RepID=A0A316UHP6_9BASI|nr:hypothetical protein BDZ90DRAFT_234975 [Jaminaea rosea]PWN24418.1 hypothetical protein BDZ90DRAFT_234975 [Jaminaea rosea]
MSQLRAVKAESSQDAAGSSSPSGSSSPRPNASRMSTGTTVVRSSSSRLIKRGDEANSPATAGTPRRSPSPPPPTTYRDIPLLSTSAATPWVHHLARFVHHQRIDPTDAAQFVPPLKLNRKQPPKPRQTWPKAGDTLVDRYGRSVRLANGKELTWPQKGEDTSEHRKILERLAPTPKGPEGAARGHANGYDASLVAPGAASAARNSNRPLFQKRVRQIHKASATARRIHNDESLPWVLEDFETGNHWESSRTARKDSVHALAKHFLDGGEGLAGPKEEEGGEEEEKKGRIKREDNRLVQHAPWIGKLEGGDGAVSSSSSSTSNGRAPSTSTSDASAQVLFVFDERNQGGFKVVPLRKTYRFMQKSRFADERGDEEREKEFERLQKSRSVGATDRFAGRSGERGSGIATPSSVRGGGAGGGVGSGLVMPGSGGMRGNNGSARGVKKEESLDEDWPALRGLSLGSYVSSRPRGLVSVSGGSNGRRRGGYDDDDVHGSGGYGGGEDATYDEVEYHEDFADDEERMGGEAELVEDADEREREDRLRREMARAGVGEGMGQMVKEEEEDDDLFGSASQSGSAQQPRGRRRDDQLTGSGRQMKKIMRALARREGQDVDGLYDSDDDDDGGDLLDIDGTRRGRGANPYAEDDEDGDDDEEEPALANPEEAIRRAMEEKREREAREAKDAATSGQGSERTSRGSTPTPGQQPTAARTPSQTGRGQGSTTPTKRQRDTSSSGSVRGPPGRPQQQQGHRRTATAASSHSRAVSPSAAVSRSPSPGPQGQQQGHLSHIPRQSSPLAHPSGSSMEGAAAGVKRPASPQPGGTTGLPPSSSNSRPASPTSKRARRDSTGSSSSSRRSTPAPGSTSTTSLERELINMVRSGQVKSIAEVIAAFKKRLQAKPELKGEMMGAFKRCLTGGTRGEVLRVKDGF